MGRKGSPRWVVGRVSSRTTAGRSSSSAPTRVGRTQRSKATLRRPPRPASSGASGHGPGAPGGPAWEPPWPSAPSRARRRPSPRDMARRGAAPGRSGSMTSASDSTGRHWRPRQAPRAHEVGDAVVGDIGLDAPVSSVGPGLGELDSMVSASVGRSSGRPRSASRPGLLSSSRSSGRRCVPSHSRRA